MSARLQAWHGTTRSLGAVLWFFAALLFATHVATPGGALLYDWFAISGASDAALEERKKRSLVLPCYVLQPIWLEEGETRSSPHVAATRGAPAAILPAFGIAEASAPRGVGRAVQPIILAIARARMFQARAPPASIA